MTESPTVIKYIRIVTNKILFVALYCLPIAGLAQFTPGLPAAFGIDSDVLSGQSQNGNLSSNGSFDWFRKPGNGANVGYGIIDTTGTSIYDSQVAGGQNVTFTRGMAYSRYSPVNGYLLLDARYARDHYGYSNSGSNRDFTTFTSGSKNGDNPTTWVTTPSGATVADKADIIDTYIHMRRDGTTINNTNPSALILAMGVNTVGNTGTRYVDFELFRERTTYNPTSGIFSNTGSTATGGHTIWEFNPNGTVKELGDMEVTFSFGTAGVTEISIYIWVPLLVHTTTIPTRFNFVPGEFYGAGVNAEYGYAKIVPKPTTPFHTWASVTSANSKAAPWGTNSKTNGGAPTGYYASEYAANDFAEVAVDITSLGIDPALSNGSNPCIPPFTRVMAKTRSSASFTSALQDFTGPYEFLDAPQAPAKIATPANLKCNVPSVTLSAAVINAGASYQWTTTNGRITSSPNAETITVDKAGKYFLTAAIVSGCPSNIDSIEVKSDYFKPVASATVIGLLNLSDPLSTVNLQGGDVNLSNFATPFGGSNGLSWKWTGPNGFTSNSRNTFANKVGFYSLELTETRNGCKDTAITPVQSLTVLPIVLGDISAIYRNGYAQLSWYTLAEYNTAYFEIERSTDGTNFVYIGKVLAKGSGINKTDYVYSDILSPSGMSYYRLRAVDRDSLFNYSKVVALSTEAVGVSLLLIYPNPFGNKVQVRIDSDKEEQIQIRIINSLGMIIGVQPEKVLKGISDIVVRNVANLPKGIYELQILSKTKTFTTKIVKQD